MFGDGNIDFVEHFCSSRSCCSNFDRSVTVNKLVAGICGVLLAWIPTAPILKKWTKLSPAFDFYSCLVWFGDLLLYVFPLAFKASSEDKKKQQQRRSDEQDLDPDQLADITWGQVRSTRVNRGLDFLAGELSRVAKSSCNRIGFVVNIGT